MTNLLSTRQSQSSSMNEASHAFCPSRRRADARHSGGRSLNAFND